MSGNAVNLGAEVSILDRPLRILHLEDDVNDRQIIRDWLVHQNIAAEFTLADNERDFLEALESAPFDIVLSDKSLPGFDGLAALKFVRAKFPNLPFVFVTGSMGEEAAIDTMKDGATDYVLKDRLSRLIPAVQRAIREAEQEEKHRQAEERNRQQAALLDKAQDAIMVTDVDDKILYWNKSAERIYGWTAEASLGRKTTDILRHDPAKYLEAKKMLTEKGSWTGELTASNRGGNELIIEGHWTLVRDELGAPRSILIIDTDITEKKMLEARFLRSQRMDSIGALAGGVAHDLNNALAPVIMGVELLKTCEDPKERERFLDAILTNSHRATELVRQILSFARGSGRQTLPVRIRLLINEISRMIRDTFPKSIALVTNLPAAELWTVQGDNTEMHQVLLNLCVNARDAMPQGGQLTLSAQNYTLDEMTAMSTGAKPGLYVMISVADTGSGIPPEVLPRIFEPFFTTKKGDKGTGLGLATVSGIVRHHGGFIDIQTIAGKGTDFKVYFPAAIAAAETAEAKPKEKALPTGHGELILIIDDEESVTELTKTTLESYGYTVQTAPNGMQGVARFREHQNDFKLVITDADMPHMDGLAAIRALRELKRDIPIIIASGDKEKVAEAQNDPATSAKTLEKPFSLDELLLTVATEINPTSAN